MTVLKTFFKYSTVKGKKKVNLIYLVLTSNSILSLITVTPELLLFLTDDSAFALFLFYLQLCSITLNPFCCKTVVTVYTVS